MNPRKNKLTVLLLAGALCAALAGCGTPAASSSPPAASSQAPSSAVSAAPGEVVSSEAPASQAGGFEEVFSKNPLDAAFREDSSDDMSMMDMTNTANQYAIFWQNEEAGAYDLLVQLSPEDQKTAVKEEEAAWVAQRDADLQKLREEADQKGNASGLEYATKVMEYYKARTKALYEKVYVLKPDFTFQFQGKGEAVG